MMLSSHLLNAVPHSDLSQMPLPCTSLPMVTDQLTLGDLHGNAVKLLHFLIYYSVVRLKSEDDYKNYVRIYNKGGAAILADFETAKTILATSTVNNKIGCVRLLGDDLADRGKNDYLTLLIIHLLSAKKVPLEILASNHSYEFLRALELDLSFKIETMTPCNSSLALQNSIISGEVKKEAIVTLMNDDYLPKIKLVSYSLGEGLNGITLYSHSRIGLEIIRLAAKKFNVVFNDESPLNLSKTIDFINHAFENHIANKTLHKLIPVSHVTKRSALNEETVISCILWSVLEPRECPPAHPLYGYAMNFVHGHLQSRGPSHFYCLDSMHGKDERHMKHNFISLVSKKQLYLTQESVERKAIEELPIAESNDIAPSSISLIINRVNHPLIKIDVPKGSDVQSLKEDLELFEGISIKDQELFFSEDKTVTLRNDYIFNEFSKKHLDLLTKPYMHYGRVSLTASLTERKANTCASRLFGGLPIMMPLTEDPKVKDDQLNLLM